MNKEINLGNLIIPVIKPQKGKDYYTESEKQELISIVTDNVNAGVLPQEQTRQSNEIIRQNNEQTRQAQETIRQTNETNRQTAETERESAENTRQSNESSRVSAEQTRTQTFNNKMDAVDTAIAGIHTSQNAYDQNATAKTSAFNENATSKTSDYNTNATNKTAEYNENASTKIAEYDAHIRDYEAELATKVDKVAGKGLSTNDFTNEEKEKLAELHNYDDTELSERVDDIEQEQTEQNTNISTNATNIESLQEENDNLKKIVSQMPQVTGQGTSITLENTIEAQFTKFDVEGNSTQDGEPSPDNEVPILSSGDNGSINEKIQTRNLFNKNEITENYRLLSDGSLYADNLYVTGSFIKVLPNTNYVFNKMAGSECICEYDKNKNCTGRTIMGSGSSITTKADTYYVRISVQKSKLDIFQYEPGSTATTYVPHQEQDYSIFVQQPMMDDDHFDRKNNKEVHTWIKYVLDGSDDENWSIRNNKFFIVDNINYSLWEKSISPNGKSNIGVISYSVLDNHTGYGLALAYGLRLNLENIDASNGGTIEQLRAYLIEHPITIYVKLKDSAYEKLPCTPEQIQQLENLPSTYKDFTIIQSQDETPAYLEVSGIRDIDTMFDKVTNAIVSLGGNV